jgi:hypothetical protein
MSYATDLVGGITVIGVPEEEGNSMVAALEEVLDCYNTQPKGDAARRLLEMDSEWRTRTERIVGGEESRKVEIDDFQMERFDDGDLQITGRSYCGGTRRDVYWQLNWILHWIRASCADAKFSGRIAEVDAENPGESAEIWFEPDENGGAFCVAWATEVIKTKKMDLKYLS